MASAVAANSPQAKVGEKHLPGGGRTTCVAQSRMRSCLALVAAAGVWACTTDAVRFRCHLPLHGEARWRDIWKSLVRILVATPVR